MDVRNRGWIGVVLTGLLVVLASGAEAFFIDEENTLSVGAKLQTRVSFRLQDAEKNGYTYPQSTKVGDLVQWRNLALIEIDHDLNNLTEDLDILWPLKKLEIQTKYHIVARFMYEALYDVGSDGFKDIRDNDRENIDNFKQAYDLWEAYVDFSRGPVFVRLGRQILAWGETDIFRLLDGINPLGQYFRRSFRGSGRPADPALDVAGELQHRHGGPVFLVDHRGVLGAGLVGRQDGPLATLRHPVHGTGPGSVSL